MVLDELSKELENTGLTEEQENSRKKAISIVVKFAEETLKHFGDIVKGVVIFGSAAKGKMKKTSDIDVWVILDNTSFKMSEDLDKVIAQIHLIGKKFGDLHIQTTPLTEFWQWIKRGSPELINFLRYGIVIYDVGFIKPVQRMLEQGLIPPSEETVKLKVKSAELKIKRVKAEMKSMVFDLRYSVLDVCQAVVMYYYKAQPDHHDIPQYLEKLVNEGKLEKEWIDKFTEINKLWKNIDHKIVKEIDGLYLDKALKLAQEFFERMKKLLPEEVLGD